MYGFRIQSATDTAYLRIFVAYSGGAWVFQKCKPNLEAGGGRKTFDNRVFTSYKGTMRILVKNDKVQK
jgi:hypothetical protein